MIKYNNKNFRLKKKKLLLNQIKKIIIIKLNKKKQIYILK